MTTFSDERTDTIQVAGKRYDVPARFRYEDCGPDSTYRFRAHAEGYSLATNRRGDGLFLWDKRGAIHQIMGTCQFSADSLEQFKRKLCAWLTR